MRIINFEKEVLRGILAGQVDKFLKSGGDVSKLKSMPEDIGTNLAWPMLAFNMNYHIPKYKFDRLH